MRVLSFISLALFLFSCGDDPMNGFKDAPVTTEVDIKEKLIAAQRQILKADSMKIAQFVKDNKWDALQTGTGLRLEITEKAAGELIKSGDRIAVDYVITDLKSDTLYSSLNTAPMELVVDLSQAESGFHELVKRMRRGEKARAILPAHLAHGLAGDDYKIPPLTTLVFEIKILK